MRPIPKNWAKAFFAILFSVFYFMEHQSARADTQYPTAVCPALEDDAALGPENLYLKGTFKDAGGWMSGHFSKSGFRLTDEQFSFFSKFKTALEKRGVKLVYVTIPLRAMVYADKLGLTENDLNTQKVVENYEYSNQSLKKIGIIAPNLLKPFMDQHLAKNLFFMRDHHWTPDGAELAGIEVAKSLQADPDFPNSKLSFEKTPLGSAENTGSFAIIEKKLCGGIAEPAETYPTYSVTQSPNSNTSLLGDSASATVALVGTSFSIKKGKDWLNFVGTIEQYSQEAVANYSVDGGGPTSALFNFLLSEDFQKQPPKYLIWETSTYIPTFSESAELQLIGMTEGTCDNPIVEKTLDSKIGGEFDLQNSEFSEKNDYYVQVSYDDRSVQAMSLSLTSQGNKLKQFDLTIPPQAQQTGEYLIELPHVEHKQLALTIPPLPATYGKVQVRICKSNLFGSTATALQTPAAAPTQTPSSKCEKAKAFNSDAYALDKPGRAIGALPTVFQMVKFAAENTCKIALTANYPAGADAKAANSEAQRQLESLKDLASIKKFTGAVELLPPAKGTTPEISFTVTLQNP